MKKSIALAFFALSLFLFSCEKESETKPAPPKNEKTESVSDFLSKYAENYKNKKLEEVVACYFKSGKTAAYASERGAKAVGWKAIKELYRKDMSTSWKLISFDLKPDYVYKLDSLAIFCANSKSSINLDGVEVDFSSRMTGVCKLTSEGWKFLFTNVQHYKSPKEALARKLDSLENLVNERGF